MPSDKLFRLDIPCKKGRLVAYSPIDIRSTALDISSHGEPLVIHAGMGKSPKRFTGLMNHAQKEGYAPVAFDTRWYKHTFDSSDVSERGISWSDQLQRRARLQHGDFDSLDMPPPVNRYSLRRVYGMEFGLDYLGTQRRAMFGHSDGARIATQVAARNPRKTTRLVLVNAAGTGNSWHAYKRLRRSNIDEILAALNGEVDPLKLAFGGSASSFYALRHPYQVLQEKRLIQSSNLWHTIDTLVARDVPVSVFAAKNDQLISFDDARLAASKRPRVNFMPVDGRHTNAYTELVSRLAIEELSAAG